MIRSALATAVCSLGRNLASRSCIGSRVGNVLEGAYHIDEDATVSPLALKGVEPQEALPGGRWVTFWSLKTAETQSQEARPPCECIIRSEIFPLSL